MKLLYFTDTHIRGTNPKNRLDDFVQALESKFIEIAGIVKEHKVDYVIHGGDLFDRPDISISVVSRFASILKLIEKPIYIVSGNHDIFGHNPETLDRTMLGLLKSFEFLKVLNKGKPVMLEKDGIKVQITGVPYSYEIDTSPESYILKSIEKDASYSINVVHGMLLDKPFIKGIPFTLVDDIVQTKADITLSGHYHSGFPTIHRDSKYFINPGSMVRVTNSLKEMDRAPKVILIDLSDGITIDEIELKSARPGHVVLDRSELENGVFRSERLVEFKQSIDEALDFEKLDINDLLTEVAFAQNISKKVRDEALRRIAAVQIRNL
jgi:DNA repair exonuclease SbcCD nuclease subunit